MTAMIIQDSRPIKLAWAGPDNEPLVAHVGQRGVTRIVPYTEIGMTWLAVWKGDVLAFRMNTRFVTNIDYE
jgi:hypothetical protein